MPFTLEQHAFEFFDPKAHYVINQKITMFTLTGKFVKVCLRDVGEQCNSKIRWNHLHSLLYGSLHFETW